MRELFIVRHGETEWNVANRLQGRLDSPLTARGKQQADRNGRLLFEVGQVNELWVSPSGRTLDTARIINTHVQAKLQRFEELMERDAGDWSGKTVTEIEASFPSAWAERQADAYRFRAPGGENLQDMLVRVKPVLTALQHSSADSIALITHGLMSKVLVQALLDLEPAETVTLRHPNNLVYRLTFKAAGIETHYFLDGSEEIEGLLRLP
jgi:probable phosphoglycerate mutase